MYIECACVHKIYTGDPGINMGFIAHSLIDTRAPTRSLDDPSEVDVRHSNPPRFVRLTETRMDLLEHTLDMSTFHYGAMTCMFSCLLLFLFRDWLHTASITSANPF